MRDPQISFLVGLQLGLAGLCHWLEHKVPKWLLVAAVLGFGYLGSRSVVLLHEIGGYFIPSVKAVVSGSPEWPLAVVLWSVVLLFVAACTMHKQVALEAAWQLRRRFGIKLGP